MGIPESIVPPSFPELEEWYDNYDAKYLKYSQKSHELGEGTMGIMLSSVGIKALRPTVRKGIIALLTDDLRRAMGFEEASSTFRWVLTRTFRLRAFAMRHFILPRFFRAPRLSSAKPNKLGRYNRFAYNFEPYYVPRTFRFLLEGYLWTGLVPGKKFKSEGYMIESDIGPDYFVGKKVKEVREESESMESVDHGERRGCPFGLNP